MLSKKSILYWTLVAVLILSLIPMSIFAQGGNEDSGGSESGGNEKPEIRITTFKPKEETEYQWTLDGSFTQWQADNEVFFTDLTVEGEREKVKDELSIEVEGELSLDASEKLVVQLGYATDEETFKVVKEFKDITYSTVEIGEEIKTISFEFRCEDLKREYFDEVEKFRLLVPYKISSGNTGYVFDTKTFELEEHETYAYTQVESDIVDVVTSYGGICIPEESEWLFDEVEMPLGVTESFTLAFNVQISDPNILEGKEVNFTSYPYLESGGEYTVRTEPILAELLLDFPMFEAEVDKPGNQGEHGNNENPGQGNGQPPVVEEPGVDDPIENPGQGNDGETGIEEPGQGNDGETGIEEPGQGNDGETGTEEPGQGNDGETGNEDPGQGNDGETGNEDPGQGNDGETGNEDPGQGNEEIIEDEIIPQGIVGLFGLWLPPTEDNFILEKSCSQIRFWVMEQLMYPKIWIFEEDDVQVSTGGALVYNEKDLRLNIGTSELKTSKGNGKHSKSNMENGEGGYYKYNLKGRNCPNLTEGRYILMIMNDIEEETVPVYFSEGVPAMLHFSVSDNLDIEIKYRNQTDNTDGRRSNIGSSR